MPCDLPFYPNRGNFQNPTEHDGNRRKHWFLVITAPGLFTFRRDAEAYATVPRDIQEFFTQEEAFAAWGENCEERHDHGNREIVPDSEEGSEREQDVSPTPASPTPARRVTRSTPAVPKSDAKQGGGSRAVKHEDGRSVKRETPSLVKRVAVSVKREAPSRNVASVKREVPALKLEAGRSPPKPLFQDDTDDDDVGMRPSPEKQQRRVDAASTGSRKRSRGVTAASTPGSKKRLREQPHSSPASPTPPSVSASPPPPSAISLSVSSASSISMSAVSTPGDHPHSDLASGSVSAPRRHPTSPRVVAPSAPPVVAVTLPAGGAAIPARAVTAARASVRAAEAQPAHRRPMRAATAAPQVRTFASPRGTTAHPPSAADKTTHFGPAAFEKFLANRAARGSVSSRAPASVAGGSVSSAGAGSSTQAAASGLATSPALGVLYNSTTRKYYKDLRMAVEEMRSTETVQAVDYEELMQFFAGESGEGEQE
ncbi:hypothetical protein C8R43DRAFT_1129968 [Mycena crocata]|nr:hypothetical protein C8R43DRAFT_1129968 [Mycena crocata]